MLGLCKELRTTTKSVADGRTIVTMMDMTKSTPEYEIAEIVDGQLSSLGGEISMLGAAMDAGHIEPLAHTGTRVEATLKDRYTGSQAEWDQLTRHEQAATGCQDPQKPVLSAESSPAKNGVIDFLKLLFDTMKYTGTTVHVDVQGPMVPPDDEIRTIKDDPECTSWGIEGDSSDSSRSLTIIMHPVTVDVQVPDDVQFALPQTSPELFETAADHPIRFSSTARAYLPTEGSPTVIIESIPQSSKGAGASLCKSAIAPTDAKMVLANCRRDGCPFRGHSKRGHGFCCNRCKTNGTHGPGCERQPVQISDDEKAAAEKKATADTKARGKLTLTQVGQATRIKVYSGGYYITDVERYHGGVFGLCGELDIVGLQPTAARDALIRAHDDLIRTQLLPMVQKVLAKLLWELGRRGTGHTDTRMPWGDDVAGREVEFATLCLNYGAEFRDAIEFFPVSCEQKDCADQWVRYDVQLRALRLQKTRAEEGIPPVGVDKPVHRAARFVGLQTANKIMFCLKYSGAHNGIDAGNTLVRLDEYPFPDKVLRCVTNYLEHHFRAEDVSDWQFHDMFEATDQVIELKVDDAEERAAVLWVRDTLRLICAQYYDVPSDKYAIEMIEHDHETNIHTSRKGFCASTPPGILVMHLNIKGEKLLRIGKEGPRQDKQSGLMMVQQQLIVPCGALGAWLAKAGRSDFIGVFPQMDAVSISVAASEVLELGGGGGGSWPGPATNFIYIKAWPGMEDRVGYYIRLPKEYCQTSEDGLCNDYRGVFKHCSGLNIQTTPHQCIGWLAWCTDQGGLTYEIELLDRNKFIRPMMYRAERDLHRDACGDVVPNEEAFAQDVLQGWDDGGGPMVFLPLPFDVGKLMEPSNKSQITLLTMRILCSYHQVDNIPNENIPPPEPEPEDDESEPEPPEPEVEHDEPEPEPETVNSWLVAAELDQYVEAIKKYGYDSIAALRVASEEDIQEMTEDTGMKKPHKKLMLVKWRELSESGS